MQGRARRGQVTQRHRLIGMPHEVANVLRSAHHRGDLVQVGEPRVYGQRVMVDVTLMDPPSIVPGTREAQQARQRQVRRIVLAVGVGSVASVGGVSAVGWIVQHAEALLGAAVVAGGVARGVAGRPLAPVVGAAVRRAVHAVVTSEGRA